MNILAIESSAKSASAAVWHEGEMAAFSYQNNGLTHSATLMPMIADMLTNAALTLDDIGLIAVAAGPGSFTGLRIGVAAAKGLAWTKKLPCCAVSSLEAAARTAVFMEKTICAVMDARCGQVYSAFFQMQGQTLTRLTPDRAIEIEQLADDMEKSKKSYILVGDAAAMCYNHVKKDALQVSLLPVHLCFQNAWGVALSAADAYAVGAVCSAQDLVPVYLRPSQAERLRQTQQ